MVDAFEMTEKITKNERNFKLYFSEVKTDKTTLRDLMKQLNKYIS